MATVVKLLGERYGPYAFGLISLLVVWFMIVAPTLRENRIDVNAMREIAVSLSKTASTVDKATERLERIVDKIEK